jgi:metal-dependent amidase/aminoacylase/carboxypeptidase family protein
MRKAASLSAAPLLISAFASAQGVPPKSPALAPLDGLYPELDKLYLDLHQTPELSLHEENTSAKMASHLRALGFEVSETKTAGTPLPSLHSSQFGPDREPTIRAASSALTIAALELLARP